MLKYKYEETDEIRNLLIDLGALKIVFENLRILPQIEENFRRESILKSSIFSARVEGNPATLSQTENLGRIHKLELRNLSNAYKFINSERLPKKLTVKLIKKIHSLIMKNISSMAGKFRQEPWAIFNSAGFAVFLAPAHFNVPNLMNELIKENNKSKYRPPIKAAIVQMLFEKIHPFADGNGRAGRLISSYIMKSSGYGFRGLIPVEEVIDLDRESYYSSLEPNHDVTDFVKFYLKSFITQANKVLEKISVAQSPKPEDFLPARQREIFLIIKDHPYTSFDSLVRRFSNINIKTLHYDLKKLIDKDFVQKIGTTKGSTYIFKDKIIS